MKQKTFSQTRQHLAEKSLIKSVVKNLECVYTISLDKKYAWTLICLYNKPRKKQLKINGQQTVTGRFL